MKTIVVMLKSDAARAWRGAMDEPDAAVEGAIAELKTLAQHLGVKLAPMHPGAQHELLVPYFSSDPVADENAERVVATLRGCPIVDSAYVQPSPAPARSPGRRKE